jgi:hypothetical protein
MPIKVSVFGGTTTRQPTNTDAHAANVGTGKDGSNGNGESTT